MPGRRGALLAATKDQFRRSDLQATWRRRTRGCRSFSSGPADRRFASFS